MAKKTKLLPGFLVLFLIAAAAGYLYYKDKYIPNREEKGRIIQKAAFDAEDVLLKKILIDPLLYINRDGGLNEIMARLPVRFETADVKKIFNEFADSRKNMSAVFSEINNEKTSSITVLLKYSDAAVSKIRLVRNKKPKIAVILDDWGYNKKGMSYLSSIKYPLTVAVLPGLVYSKISAETAHQNKKAVMLHLPMQPQMNLPREKRMIQVSMSAAEVKFIVDSLAAEIPYFSGVNNHQGSLATEDARIMEIVLKEMKGRNLYFIDSLTSSKSIVLREARKLGVPSGKRDVFIDNQKEIEYNEKQINELKAAAKKRGYAIGIGHDDVVTLKALEKNMPLLEAEGFEFVYAAELVF